MEKNGEIRDDITPPEDKPLRCGCQTKKASIESATLEDHLTKRAADAAKKRCDGKHSTCQSR